ncbi:MAG: LysR family transcriptional regulator [Paracoccaceae bacterium]
MNLTQLTVFREVMATGSISQAAKTLNRTQPAISLSIKNLEKSLGLTLFERRGRQLLPVPEAQYLLAEASEILDRLSTVSSTIKGLLGGASGTLNIATMPGPSAYLFPHFISKAIGENPNIKITLSTRSSPQIMEMAGTQNIDFGFADFDHPIGRRPQFEAEIIQANCYCAVNREHPLAIKKVITIGDLVDVPMGAMHGTHPFQRRIHHEFQKESIEYTPTIICQYFLPLIQFVGSAQCCTIVDPLTVTTEREMNLSNGNVVFVPFEASLRYEYAILKPNHRPPSQLALNIQADWKAEVLRMLTEIGAEPSTNDFAAENS